MRASYWGSNGCQLCILPLVSSSISPVLIPTLLGGNGGPAESADFVVRVGDPESSLCRFPNRLGWTGGGRAFFADPAMSVDTGTFPKLAVELAVLVLVGRGGFESEGIPDKAFCEMA